ncbi:MAG: metallophosphoesterase family protein [Sedimentisphaerales bacterium]|nr:metallophosphoesterase family protein [Sedimentisphaerales bacterium]
MEPIHENRKRLELEYYGRESERDTLKWYHIAAKWVLELPFLLKPGRRNAGDVRLRRIELSIRSLPTAFDGCRILFISDMHLDGVSDWAERIVHIADGIDYDVCLLGGDYSFGYDASDERMRDQVREVVTFLVGRSQVFGILGNHDEYRTAELLDGLGVVMLLNENVCVERDGEKIFLVGVDDDFFFRAAELKKAGATVPEGACKILLAHSPDLYEQAARSDYALYLAGHTHGGQICLPGGVAVVSNARVPRRLIRGKWEYGGMAGYTSYGVGTSVVPVRFFCPPEVALLSLTKRDETE